MCQPVAQHVMLPEDFFDGVDVVALATTVHKPCQHCGRIGGMIVRGGVAFCQHCNNGVLVAKQPKPKRQSPVPRPAIIPRRPSSTPRPREGGARMAAASGRDGSGERDDGGGSDDGGGGSGSDPPPALACDIAGRAL